MAVTALKGQENLKPLAGRRVLVVDDSAGQRRLIGLSLKQWGYDVAEAETGSAALELCRREDFDLVISDWVMPGLSGPDFCKAYRALPGGKYGYFILITSKAEKEDVTAGLEAGADDFLSKPVSAAELRARLQAGERQLDLQRELQAKNDQLGAALSEVQRLYSTLDYDLIEARRLQQSLVRGRQLDFGRAAVTLSLRPSGHVGGDLVGYFPRGDDRIAVFSVDVSGHGVASAMLAARLSGIFASAFPEGNVLFAPGTGRGSLLEPAEMTAKLNHLLLEVMGLDHYFTWACADLDLGSGRVVLVQAGHPHPMLLRPSGQVELLGQGGLPVGLLPGVQWGQTQLTLKQGERLILMTDGLTECRNTAGEELGDDGLQGLIARHAALRGEAFLNAVETDLEEFNGGPDFSDDVSAAVIEWRG